MRVVAGNLGGRIFESPHGHRTHPMSEKMRGAIFGTLGDITGLSVLDAFSGSGALSIEAASRGADIVIAIEVNKGAHTVIESNIKKFDLNSQISATRAYAAAWSTRHQAKLFDLILLDPPYDKPPYRDLDRMPRHLKSNGILVLSWPSKESPMKFKSLEIIKKKTYGDSQLLFYKEKES